MGENFYQTGLESIKCSELAVVSLAGGAGSPWTKGAGVVKSLNPFVKIREKHRNFIEEHLSKSTKISSIYGGVIPHIFTTSYLTHDAIEQSL